jgi:mannose-6-phosphate isomerase-like protein (cupin superfamily)
MSPPSVVGLLGSEITVLHAEAGAAYSLLRWRTPAGAPSPPLHLHRRTDEGFYVLQGALCLLIEDETRVHGPGEFALVRRGQRHSFWNLGEEAAVYLTFIGSSLSRVGDMNVEFADGEVDHGDVVAGGAVAAGAAFGGLDE